MLSSLCHHACRGTCMKGAAGPTVRLAIGCAHVIQAEHSQVVAGMGVPGVVPPRAVWDSSISCLLAKGEVCQSSLCTVSTIDRGTSTRKTRQRVPLP